MKANQLDLLQTEREDAATRVGRAAFAVIRLERKGNPAFRLTEAALVNALRPALVKEIPKAARQNGRVPLFDALAAACCIVAPFTRSAAGQVAKALKEIREIDPMVTPDELKRIATAIRRKYENAGPMGVAAHYHEFTSYRRDRNAKPVLPAAPKGWLEMFNRLYPDSAYTKGGRFEITNETDYEWSRLSAEIRAEIGKALDNA